MMVVIRLEACPPGVAGSLSRFLVEVAPGLLVGSLNPRQRDSLWRWTKGELGNGSALIAWPQPGSLGGIQWESAGPQRRSPLVLCGISLALLSPEPEDREP